MGLEMGGDMTLMKDDRDLRGEKKFGGSTTSDRTYTSLLSTGFQR
jgi:hypothetical protein